MSPRVGSIARVVILIFVFCFAAVTESVSAQAEHCPPGGIKYEGNYNSTVLPAGTEFCIKGSTQTTSGTADGSTSLIGYVQAAGIVNDQGQPYDVSYYVIYSSPTPTPIPPTPTLVPPTPTSVPLTPTEVPSTNTPEPTPTSEDKTPFPTEVPSPTATEVPDTVPTATATETEVKPTQAPSATGTTVPVEKTPVPQVATNESPTPDAPAVKSLPDTGTGSSESGNAGSWLALAASILFIGAIGTKKFVRR